MGSGGGGEEGTTKKKKNVTGELSHGSFIIKHDT